VTKTNIGRRILEIQRKEDFYFSRYRNTDGICLALFAENSKKTNNKIFYMFKNYTIIKIH
jgi:hypothetical protein